MLGRTNRDSPQFISMGLKPLDTKAWVEPDALFPQYFDNKCRLFAHDAQACFAETQGSRLAQEECAERLLVYLCEQHGQLYRRDEHELHIEGLADGLSLAGDAPPLMRAGFWLQDDICLLEQRAGRHVLIAASLCAPSSWYLQEKIGLPLAGIHEPVPGLNAQIGRQIENVLEYTKDIKIDIRTNSFQAPTTQNARMEAK